MEWVVGAVVLGTGLLLLSWALLAWLAERLRPGTAKDLVHAPTYAKQQ